MVSMRLLTIYLCLLCAWLFLGVDADCEAGWINANKDVLARDKICLKYFDQALPYTEARQSCRDHNSFLINYGELAVSQILLNSSLSTQMSSLYSTNNDFWTGQHHDGVAFVNDGLLPSSPQLNLYRCSFYLGKYGAIAPDGAAGYKCGILDKWSEVTFSPCLSAKISESRRFYLEQYKGNKEVRIADLQVTRCTESKQYICMSYYENDHNVVSPTLTTPTVTVSVAYNPTNISHPLSCSLEIDGIMSPIVSRPIAYVTPGGDIVKQVVFDNPLQTTQGGHYRCVVWCEEIKDYLYSVPVLIDNGGKFYYSTITFPLLGNNMLSWYPTIPYYFTKLNTKRRSGMDLRTVQNLITAHLNSAFSQFVSKVDNVQQCSGCHNSKVNHQTQMKILGIQNIRNVSDVSGVLVSVSVVFSAPSMGGEGSQRSKRSSSDWTVINREMRIELLKRLNLEDAAAGHYVHVSEWQENQAAGDPTNFPSPTTTTTQQFTSITTLDDQTTLSKDIDVISATPVLLQGNTTLPDNNQDTPTTTRESRVTRNQGDKTTTGIDNQSDALPATNNQSDLTTLKHITLDSTTKRVAPPCHEIKHQLPTLGVNITIPEAPVGTVVKRSVCPINGKPLVTAECRPAPGRGSSRWAVVVPECRVEEDEKLPNSTKKLAALSIASLGYDGDAHTAVASLSQTAEISRPAAQKSVKSPGSVITAQDVSLIADILNTVSSSVILHNETVVDEYFSTFVETVSNILDVDESEIRNNKRESRAAHTQIVEALENLIHTPLPAALINSSSEEGIELFSTVQPNLAFKLTTEKEIVGVVSHTEELTDSSISYISRSAENGSRADNNMTSHVVELQLGDSGINRTHRKAFLVYAGDKLHRSVNQRGYKPGGRIVSASLAEADGTPIAVKNQESVVIIKYPNVLTGIDEYNQTQLCCGFWEQDSQDWSTEGCSITIDNQTGVVCSCNHLTDFAVLVDPHRDGESSGPHAQILNIITMTGLAVSSIALILVLFTAAVFQRLRKTNSQKVLICLAVSLLGLNLTFLIGIKQVRPPIACYTVAATLHYFLLCSFAWMLVEAILQYLRFVRVLGTYIPRFMVKSAVPAFIVPALIVAVTMSIDENLYRAGDDYCWLRKDAIIYTVLIPIALVLTTNFVIFGMVLYNLTASRRRMKAHQTEASHRRTATLHLKAAIAVTIILGLTWVFAYIALISKTTTVIFQYLFCIFNSMQGLLIFLFHNIREPTVQSVWVSLCSSGVKNLTSANQNKPIERKALDRDSSSKLSSSCSSQSQSRCEEGHMRHMTMSESLSLTGRKLSLSLPAREQATAKNRVDDVALANSRYLETSI